MFVQEFIGRSGIGNVHAPGAVFGIVRRNIMELHTGRNHIAAIVINDHIDGEPGCIKSNLARGNRKVCNLFPASVVREMPDFEIHIFPDLLVLNLHMNGMTGIRLVFFVAVKDGNIVGADNGFFRPGQFFCRTSFSAGVEKSKQSVFCIFDAGCCLFRKKAAQLHLFASFIRQGFGSAQT